MSGEVFLTINEVCDLMRVDRATGRNWVKLGKLVPDASDSKGRPLFERDAVRRRLRELQTSEQPRLKSRRNKSALRGRGLYGNYAGRDSGNVGTVNSLVSSLKNDRATMRACLLESAVRLLWAAGRAGKPGEPPSGSYFTACAEGELDPFPFLFLLEPLMDGRDAAYWSARTQKLPDFTLEYVPFEDTLGLLYLSLCDISSRLEGGRYYTPQDLTDEVVADLGSDRDRFLDPCCGSGNFLLRLLKRGIAPGNLFGADIDGISLALAQVNFAVNAGIADPDFYATHFRRADTLMTPSLPECTVILGNPPWGGCAGAEAAMAAARFKTAGRNRSCLADLFVERMLGALPEGGILRFLLPEALLNVAVHEKVRDLISEVSRVRQVRYLGEVFHAVQCPSVVLTLEKGRGGSADAGVEVTLPDRRFTATGRDPHDFNFRADDGEHALLEAIAHAGRIALGDTMSFALGIVTGDNAGLVSQTRGDGMVPVLRGTAVSAHRIAGESEYLRFDPEVFQQCAAESVYRAAPKILYRFIAKFPVAAVDLRGRFMLNSCNCMIPRPEVKDPEDFCFFVAAILNSATLRYYFTRRFHTLKILRSQLEKLPVPAAPESEIREVAALARALANAADGERGSLEDELEQRVAALFSLTASQLESVRAASADGD